MGSSLLTLFLNRNVATGFTTILIAHIMFNISYVVVTVKARLAGFDRHLAPRQHRSMIVVLVDEMDRDAARALGGGDHSLVHAAAVHAGAAMAGEEPGMDIDDA